MLLEVGRIAIKEMILDFNKTIATFNKGKDIFKKGECYSNTVNAMAYLFLKQFRQCGYKIGYGYVGGVCDLLTRHCYIITDDDKIIDTTVLFRYDKNELENEMQSRNVKYFTFASLNNDEFLDKLAKADNNLDLKNSIINDEKEFHDFLMNSDLEVNETDHKNYLLRFE